MQSGQFVCDIGQLRAPGSGSGPSAATFYIVFTTPLSPAEGSAGPFIADYRWNVFYGEGANDSLNAAHNDGSQGPFLTKVELDTFTSATQVKDLKSVVPQQTARTEFFTGTGIPTTTDTVATKISVPKLPAATATAIAEIYERKPGESVPGSTEPLPLACPPQLLTCTDFITVRLPVAFSATDPLRITLLKDSKSWSGSANSVPVFYQHEDNGPYFQLGNCPATGPVAGVPCIKERKKLTKNDSPDPEAPGDLQILVEAIENGRYTN
jgi:hypothetical protein